MFRIIGFDNCTAADNPLLSNVAETPNGGA
jgi:hypothetical protein